MGDKRVHLDALRDGASKEEASISDHELDSDFVVRPEWKGYDAAKHEVKVEPIRKIKVTKLPEETTEDILMNFFENRRRNGGGPIESVEYHPAISSAIIEFQEADDVDRVLKKRPLLFLKKQISIEEYVEMEEEDEEPPCHTIEVRGFAENTVEEVLEMYFENAKRSGGGDITSVQIEDGVAHLTFEDEDVASSVCEREHILCGRKLSVSLHLPKKKSSSAVEAKIEEEEEPVCTVEVRGYKVGSEITIELYFENAKRSGGDEIVKFDPVDSEGIIFITFASEEVARRVAGRQHVLADCILDVKLYEPPKRKSARNLSHISSKKPEESVPHCTVEVRGVTKSLNLTTLQLYFENKKRSGGDEIVTFEYKEENEIAYITYESEEVAQRVVIHGKHKVEGQPLKVILYIPPQHKPTYGDRVLLAGLSSNITRDALINFMEARINLTPTDFLYDEKGDKVMIRFDENIGMGETVIMKIYFSTFSEDDYVIILVSSREGEQTKLYRHQNGKLRPFKNPLETMDFSKYANIDDFQKLEHACKKRVIDNNYLQPSKVPVSNCILVLNLKITTTEDTIELYFENEKRSGGGPVEKVVFNREEEYCLVYFEDHTICDHMLQRKHKIDGSELQVFMYYECLGLVTAFKPPKPVKLEGLEFAKIQFLMQSEPNRTALEKQLENCFTLIQWPKTEKDCTVLICMLTSNVPGCKLKALSWAKQAEQNLNSFLEVISVHELRVFKEMFETVLQNIQNLTIANPDGVALFVKNAEFSIQVVGHKAVATVVIKDIEDIIKKAQSDFDKKKKQTRESLTNLKHHQLKLLLAQKYPSQMEQQFKGLKVKMNLNKNEIMFEGLMEDIRTAQVAMYEAVHNAAVSTLNNIPEGRLFLYKSKEVKDYIDTKLKSKKVVGVWEVEGTNLNIYANSDEAVVQSSHIIKDSVKEHQRDLQDNQRSLVQSQQWKDKMKDLEKQYQRKLNVVLAQDLSKLFLYVTDDIFGAVIDEIVVFLSPNTIFETLVACNSGMIQLIQKKDNEVDKIAKDLANFVVQITIHSKGGFLIRGNQEGNNQATYRLQELVNRVKHCDHELKQPGIAWYMEGKGQEHITKVMSQIPCVIQMRGQEQYGLTENDKETNSFVPGGSDEQVPRKVPLKSQTGRPELTSNVWIDVYAWDKQTLDAAINKLDILIKNDFRKDDFTEPIVKHFSHVQVSGLQRIADQWRIQLTIDPKIGRITIEGVTDGIVKVSNEIHRLIREAEKKEQDRRCAELLKKLVQWHYTGITTDIYELREYPADVNLLIETAYKDQKQGVTFFTNDGEEYKIDFSKMEEFPVNDPSDLVTVVRKDLIQVMALSELPATWAKMAPNENLKVVNLQSTDKEYQDVQQQFLRSVGGNRTMLKLQRIQNRTLYQQYEAKKKLIEQNNPGHQNESSLWHGTSVDSVDSISMYGFNRSYCGKNATAYGDGVYFAKNASYSASDMYSRPDYTGSKKMYLCRVLTGQYTTGRQGMRVAPAKSSSNPNDLYDSVVNNTSNPEIFVIFSDTQAIPEYLITFK